MSDTIRRYAVSARSTDTFGRVLASARHHHIVVDGPVQNGCPGEALTPPELFLQGVATCGVELMQVLAHHEGMPIPQIETTIEATFDPEHPPRLDVRTFDRVAIHFRLRGLSYAQAETLVEAFKRR